MEGALYVLDVITQQTNGAVAPSTQQAPYEAGGMAMVYVQGACVVLVSAAYVAAMRLEFEQLVILLISTFDAASNPVALTFA